MKRIVPTLRCRLKVDFPMYVLSISTRDKLWGILPNLFGVKPSEPMRLFICPSVICGDGCRDHTVYITYNHFISTRRFYDIESRRCVEHHHQHAGTQTI